MAARSKKEHDALTRQKIQTSQLINRLMDHALGKCEMSNTQVQAARILLGKTLPDLQAHEHTGEVQHYVLRAPEPIRSADEWQQQHRLQ